MAKFLSNRDWNFVQQINSELSDEIIQVAVILWKLKIEDTAVNIYGESLQKQRYEPVELTAFIDYPEKTVTSDGMIGIDSKQNPQFRFVRELLRNKEVYPETGDILGYNDLYYEIDNVQEVQLLASRPDLNHSIICDTHLTRKDILQIEPRQR